MRTLLHALGAGLDAAAFTYATGAYLRYRRQWSARAASWVGFVVGVAAAHTTAALIQF